MKAPVPLAKVVSLWVAALTAVAALGVVAVGQLNERVFGPEAMVRQLHSFMAAGQGGKALGLTGWQVPDGNPLLLDGDGLRGATAAVQDFTVAGTRELSPGHVEVTASYSVDGTPHTTTYALSRTTREWLVFQRWEFEALELPAVRVTADSTTDILVNGLPSPLDSGEQALPVFLPAVVDASFRTPYFEGLPQRLAVDSGDTARTNEISLATSATPALAEEIAVQLRTYLDACAEQQVLQPAGCPLTYETNARVDPSTIDWRITSYPQPSVSAFDGGWVLRPLEVGAQLSLVEQDLATGTKEGRNIAEVFGFTAKLRVDGAEVEVTPAAFG